jgi:acyl-CoA thioesterase-1
MHLSKMLLLLLLVMSCSTQSLLANDTSELPKRLLVLGDSLAAGYGLALEEAFPAQLEKALRQAGHNVAVINAGVSGDTTAGGLSRLDWALADKPHLVLVELGGNDALRGLPPEETRANLNAILERIEQAGAKTLLAGMQAPRNLGAQYTEAFNRIYPQLAQQHRIMLYPFFLDGVALDPALNQGDGIHPNARGVAVIVARILPAVEAALKTIQK